MRGEAQTPLGLFVGDILYEPACPKLQPTPPVLAPTVGMTPFEFRGYVSPRNPESRSYRVALLRDSRFSRFDTIPGVRDRQIDTHDDAA